MRRRQRVFIVLGSLLAAFGAYEAVTTVVAYTDDAYVRSDLVAVASQVTGRVVALHVADNQPVKAGNRLFTLDPVPFQLAVAEKQAVIEEAAAQIAADQPILQAAQDRYSGAVAAADFATEQQKRVADLLRTRDATAEALDAANARLREAQASVEAATAGVANARAQAALHQAASERANADMAIAQWQLARTEVVAPGDGTVNALTLRPGDTARENVPVIGIVDAHAWRVVANYKQDYIRRFREGGTAWVWLDSQPWRFHRARIAGIARGISRNEDPDKLLPYVAPSTDWIRLQRRFPVTLNLVDADGLTLFMGADARAVIFP